MNPNPNPSHPGGGNPYSSSGMATVSYQYGHSGASASAPGSPPLQPNAYDGRYQQFAPSGSAPLPQYGGQGFRHAGGQYAPSQSAVPHSGVGPPTHHPIQGPRAPMNSPEGPRGYQYQGSQQPQHQSLPPAHSSSQSQFYGPTPPPAIKVEGHSALHAPMPQQGYVVHGGTGAGPATSAVRHDVPHLPAHSHPPAPSLPPAHSHQHVVQHVPSAPPPNQPPLHSFPPPSQAPAHSQHQFVQPVIYAQPGAPVPVTQQWMHPSQPVSLISAPPGSYVQYYSGQQVYVQQPSGAGQPAAQKMFQCVNCQRILPNWAFKLRRANRQCHQCYLDSGLYFCSKGPHYVKAEEVEQGRRLCKYHSRKLRAQAADSRAAILRSEAASKESDGMSTSQETSSTNSDGTRNPPSPRKTSSLHVPSSYGSSSVDSPIATSASSSLSTKDSSARSELRSSLFLGSGASDDTNGIENDTPVLSSKVNRAEDNSHEAAAHVKKESNGSVDTDDNKGETDSPAKKRRVE